MSYLKGKDIKQKGDCLTHLFIKKIQILTQVNKGGVNHPGFYYSSYQTNDDAPEGFDKW